MELQENKTKKRQKTLTFAEGNCSWRDRLEYRKLLSYRALYCAAPFLSRSSLIPFFFPLYFLG